MKSSIKDALPFLVILFALCATVAALLGSRGLPRLYKARAALSEQKEKNLKLKEYLRELDEASYRLEHDDRALEKTARDELGLARANELIFFFEKKEKAHGAASK